MGADEKALVIVPVAQAVAGVGGIRVTLRVPQDAPNPCAVEVVVYSGDGQLVDRMAELKAVPLGAPETLIGSEVAVHGRCLWPCEPGGTYRVTVRADAGRGAPMQVGARVADVS